MRHLPSVRGMYNFLGGKETRIIGKLRLYLETTVFNYYFDKDRPGHEDVLRNNDCYSRGGTKL